MVYKRLLMKLPKLCLLLVIVSVLIYHFCMFIAEPGLLAMCHELLPGAVQTAIGMPPILNMQDAFAFVLRVGQLVYLLLCFCFLFSGSGIVREQQRSGLMEFYLTRKVTRRGYYMTLWWRGLTLAALMSLLFAGETLWYLHLGGVAAHTVWGTCLLIGLRCGIVWMTIYAVGLCFGALCRRSSTARLYTLLVFLALYVCGVLHALLPSAWYLSFGAVYHAAIPENVILDGARLVWQTLPLPALLLVVSTLGGVYALRKRDLAEEIGG